MSIFKKMENTLSLKDKVYSKIKIAIIKGELRPDQPISETEMAVAMNISRAPIREALNKLEQDGFVVNIPRKGCKVTPITKKEISDIYEMRLVMEPFALQKSIDKIPM